MVRNKIIKCINYSGSHGTCTCIISSPVNLYLRLETFTTFDGSVVCPFSDKYCHGEPHDSLPMFQSLQLV